MNFDQRYHSLARAVRDAHMDSSSDRKCRVRDGQLIYALEDLLQRTESGVARTPSKWYNSYGGCEYGSDYATFTFSSRWRPTGDYSK